MSGNIALAPHPPWATHAMRFGGDEAEHACRQHAATECPAELNYTVRQVHGEWEWFAPATPPDEKP